MDYCRDVPERSAGDAMNLDGMSTQQCSVFITIDNGAFLYYIEISRVSQFYVKLTINFKIDISFCFDCLKLFSSFFSLHVFI